MKQHIKRFMASVTAAAMLITMTSSALTNVWGADEETAGNGFHAALEGMGASVSNGILTLPGGAAGSEASYVSIPGAVYEGRDTLTDNLYEELLGDGIEIWQSNCIGIKRWQNPVSCESLGCKRVKAGLTGFGLLTPGLFGTGQRRTA